MSELSAYQEALRIVSSPGSYDQAFEVYKAIGEPFALVLAVPFLMLLLMGAIAEDNYGSSLWNHNGYWVTVFFVLLAVVLMILGFPYLLVQF